jgi:hypothetical protein
MKRPYLIAAVLSLLAAGIRSWDGEFGPLQSARDSALEAEVIGFFHLTWYMVTIVFVLSAITFAYLAVVGSRSGAQVAGVVLGALFLAWSLAIGIVSWLFVWHPGTVIPMLVTLVIGTLALLGAKGERTVEVSESGV